MLILKGSREIMLGKASRTVEMCVRESVRVCERACVYVILSFKTSSKCALNMKLWERSNGEGCVIKGQLSSVEALLLMEQGLVFLAGNKAEGAPVPWISLSVPVPWTSYPWILFSSSAVSFSYRAQSGHRTAKFPKDCSNLLIKCNEYSNRAH